MTNEEFDALTQQILDRIADDDRVLGFVVLGSGAVSERRDEWSDHDFFLITRSGEQETFRNHFWWIADEADIAGSIRETAHGVQVILTNGHLLEFAVFDLHEISVAKVNVRAVLLDKHDVAERVDAVVARPPGMRPIGEALGMFISHVMVGVGRYRRGELLAARERLTSVAVPNLLIALLQARDLKAPDSLDLTRRIETVLPDESAAIMAALAHSDLAVAGDELLNLAEATLGDRPDFPTAILAAVRARLAR